MKLPTATYRLQFRQGMDLDRAAGLVPYFSGLGVSHLYASPLFTAQTGSTHGYDITDPNEIDPVLGGPAGLGRLSRALKAAGMGLILDIVPNHLAFSVETPWLRDVLRHGSGSRYYGHFALDLEDQRLRLPWLPEPFEDVLAQGGLAVGDDADGPVLAAGALRVPLAETTALAAARGGDPGALRALHEGQPWRLVHWRTEGDAITHRRFFNVTALIGVRVERDEVFEDAHELVFRLVREGVVDGLRVDHVDGLLDPEAYLQRLRARVGEVPIWVEKIRSPGEALPASWPIEGTTGYGVARSFARLLTDAAGLDRIDALYREVTGRSDPIDDVLFRARRQIMTHDLAAELWLLHRQFAAIAAADPRAAEFGPEALREALLALIAAFPRYRTYMTADCVSAGDAALVRETAMQAERRLVQPGALPFLADVLTRADRDTAGFRLRFQQVTSAAVAKGLEDTAFFREVRLLSSNEVGGQPDDAPLGVEAFHRAMEKRAAEMPRGLTLTSSHDTKRSEDARMRLVAISRVPEAFAAWHRICSGFAPEELTPNLVWYLAQTFLALDEGEGATGERLGEHAVKAMREARSETFWAAPDHALEEAAVAYARRIAQHFPSPAAEVAEILRIGDDLSLVQTALKLTVPGIPDIYQGCEAASYRLTDPDNRNEPDFEALAAALSGAARLPRMLDRLKFDLTRRILQLRREQPDLFAAGAYRPCPAAPGLCVYERQMGNLRLQVALDVEGVGAIDVAMPEGRRVWPPQDAADGGPVRIVLVGGAP